MIAALINHLWQSTLFCGVVWLVTRGLRSNAAALRHGLWLLASVKFMIPFAALYTLGALAGLPVQEGTQPVFLNEALQAAGPVLPTFSPTRSFTISGLWGAPLLFVWFAGAAWFGSRWLIAWRAANGLIRAARPAPGALPDVCVTDSAVEPAVAGSFRSVVLLPAALLARLERAQLGAVLAHEHEHIRRHDNLKDHVHRLVETLFWFHPAVWWIGRRLIEERELACDEAVIGGGYDGADYAAGILAVCEHCAGGETRRPMTMSALAGDLSARIRRILRGSRPAELGFFKASALLLGTLMVAGLPLLGGAADGTVKRHLLLASNSRLLADSDADITLTTGGQTRVSLTATAREVRIGGASLRDLVALTYGVARSQVIGGADWMDTVRYDVRVVAPSGVGDPANLDPAALRPLVDKLLAARFGLRLQVAGTPL